MFLGVAIKTAVLVSWSTTPVQCPYANLMICSLKFKKNRCDHIKVALDFALLVLNLCPIYVVILLPIWINLTMGQLLLFFLCNFSSFFLATSVVSLQPTILAIQQIIIFLRYSIAIIYSDLLNCLKSLATLVITTKNG